MTSRALRGHLFASMDAHDIDALRLHTQQQKPWGSERFCRQIEALAQRSVEVRPRGRPIEPGEMNLTRMALT